MKIKSFFWLACLLAIVFIETSAQAQRLYELRVYTATEGNLENVIARFRNHAVKYFPDHNMKLEGFWIPVDNAENKIYWMLSYENREARDKAWASFRADKRWVKAKAKSEKKGPIVGKVEEIFLNPTDFSANNFAPVGNRVFELRIYTSPEGKMPDLLARFRNHTCKLFEKHGMTNIFYGSSVEKDPATQSTLYYFITHKDRDAAKQNFANFGADPEWKRVAEESQKNGKIVANITSVFLYPSDFSPIR